MSSFISQLVDSPCQVQEGEFFPTYRVMFQQLGAFITCAMSTQEHCYLFILPGMVGSSCQVEG